MRIQVQKWGNSLAVRIPKAFAAETGIAEGNDVDLVLDGGDIRMRPVKRSYRLAELLEQIRPENLHGETDAGTSIGGESW